MCAGEGEVTSKHGSLENNPSNRYIFVYRRRKYKHRDWYSLDRIKKFEKKLKME